jgi:hypothetical protein
MPPRKRKNSPAAAPITDYRHDTTRKNIPPAGLAQMAHIRPDVNMGDLLKDPPLQPAFHRFRPAAGRAAPVGER